MQRLKKLFRIFRYVIIIFNSEYQTNSAKIKEVKTKLDAAKKNQHEIWSKIQPAVDEYNKYKAELDQTRKAWDDLSEESKIEEKKIELLTLNIEEVKKKRDAFVNKYYEAEDKHMDQQRLLRKIEWMTREKERALKDAAWRKEREEEERARIPVHPFMEEIAICEQLITYCKKYLGTAKKEEEKKEVISTADIASKIAKGGLKPMDNKKSKEGTGLTIIGAVGKKKGRDRDDRKKAKAKPEEASLEVDLGTLSLFDKVQVQPPLFVKNLAAALEKLIEKKKHFEELPATQPKKEEKKAEEPKKVEEEKKVEPAAVEVKPAEEVKPAVEVKPAEEVKPAVDGKPAEAPAQGK